MKTACCHGAGRPSSSSIRRPSRSSCRRPARTSRSSKIAELQPDLVLATHSGLTQDQFDKLSALAPTVAYPERPWGTSWEDQISIAGQALGRSDKAQELTESVEEYIRTAKAEHPEFEGRTIAFNSANQPGMLNFYFESDPRMKLLSSLGFDIDPLTQQRAGASTTQLATSVSMETLPTDSPDVLVSWYLSTGKQREVEDNPLFQRMKPVQSDSYIGLVDPPLVFAASSPNILDIPWLIECLAPQLSKATNNSRQE